MNKDIYEVLFEENDDVLLIIEKDTGKIVHVNKAACQFYQYTYQELTALTINKINSLYKPHVKIKKQLINFYGNEYYYCAVTPSSEHQRQSILDSMSIGIFEMNLEGVCTFCSKSGYEILGYDNEEELIGKDIFLNIHHMKFKESRLYKTLLEKKALHIDHAVFKKKDGTSFEVVYHAYPQFKNGKFTSVIISFFLHHKKDIYISYHDPLTKLHNRKYFEDTLNNFNTKDNLPISIIYGDVNGLKLTNDVFGHEAGDLLLLTSANILKKVCPDAIIARIGGDEFVIVLSNTNEKEVIQFIENIEKMFLNEQNLKIKASISLGYATKVELNDDIQQTVKAAEDMMYKNKILTRNKMGQETVTTIIQVLHQKCPREKLHSKHIGELCYRIGKNLNKNETELRKLRDAGYLHDIGKIALSDQILNKNDVLNDEEKKKMMQHPVTGFRILNLFDHTMDLAEGVLNHHEYWDGSGYPKGIKGNEIPEIARIIAVAEAYDSMTNHYNKISMEEAILEIQKQSGIKYDPTIVDVFINMMRK